MAVEERTMNKGKKHKNTLKENISKKKVKI